MPGIVLSVVYFTALGAVRIAVTKMSSEMIKMKRSTTIGLKDLLNVVYVIEIPRYKFIYKIICALYTYFQSIVNKGIC